MGYKEKFEQKFKDFWPVYVGAHSKKWCRILHYVGTAMGMMGFVLFILTGEPWLIPAAILCGYGFAWTGHYAFEENSPLTFKHPVLSLYADFVMLGRAISGRLSEDLERNGSIPA